MPSKENMESTFLKLSQDQHISGYIPQDFPQALNHIHKLFIKGRGEQKILLQQFSCLRYITKTDPVPGRLGIVYNSCYK